MKKLEFILGVLGSLLFFFGGIALERSIVDAHFLLLCLFRLLSTVGSMGTLYVALMIFPSWRSKVEDEYFYEEDSDEPFDDYQE